MPKYTILPVAEALKQFQLFEYVLDFYDEGLRGLIRDHVFVSNAHLCDLEELESSFDEDPLEEKIVTAYTTSLNYRHDVAMGTANRKLNAALSASRQIRKWVDGMMYTAYLHDVYSVHAQYHRWHGKDLIVRLDIWS